MLDCPGLGEDDEKEKKKNTTRRKTQTKTAGSIALGNKEWVVWFTWSAFFW